MTRQVFEAMCLGADSPLSIDAILGRHCPPLKPRELVCIFHAGASLFSLERDVLNIVAKFDRGDTISKEVLLVSAAKTSPALANVIPVVDAAASSMCSSILDCSFCSCDVALAVLRMLSESGMCFVSSAAQVLLHLLMRFLIFRFSDVHKRTENVSDDDDCIRVLRMRIAVDDSVLADTELTTEQLTHVIVALSTYKVLLRRSTALSSSVSVSFFEFYRKLLQPKVLRGVLSAPSSQLSSLVTAASEAGMLPSVVIPEVISRITNPQFSTRARNAILVALSPHASTHPEIQKLLDRGTANTTQLVGQIGLSCRSGKLSDVSNPVEEIARRRDGEVPSAAECRIILSCLAKAGAQIAQPTTGAAHVKQLVIRWALSSDEALEALSCCLKVCGRPGDWVRLFDVCLDQCASKISPSARMQAALLVLGRKLSLPVNEIGLWRVLRDEESLTALSHAELSKGIAAAVGLGDDHPSTIACLTRIVANPAALSLTTAVTIALDIWLLPETTRQIVAEGIGKSLIDQTPCVSTSSDRELVMIGGVASCLLFGCTETSLKLKLIDFARRRVRDESSERLKCCPVRVQVLNNIQVDHCGGWSAISLSMLVSQALLRCTDDVDMVALAQNYWKITLKGAEKLAMTKCDAEAAQLAVAVALNFGAGSQVLDSILTKVRDSRVDLQLLAIMAYGLVGTDKRRPQVSEFVAHVLTCPGLRLYLLPAHALRNLIIFVNRESDRVAIGHLLSDTLNAALWSALEHKLSRLGAGDLLRISAFAPTTLLRQLAEVIAEHISANEVELMMKLVVPFFLKVCTALPTDARPSTVDLFLKRADLLCCEDVKRNLGPLREK